MPLPPPPMLALIMSGYPIARAAARTAASPATGSNVPGTVGTPSSRAIRRAAVLSPSARIAGGGGPMKTSPAPAHASATLEARPALFPEGLHALPVIVGLDQDRLAEALQGPGRMQIGAHAALDHPLGQAERLRGLGGQARGERARLARELGVVHHTID